MRKIIYLCCFCAFLVSPVFAKTTFKVDVNYGWVPNPVIDLNYEDFVDVVEGEGNYTANKSGMGFGAQLLFGNDEGKIGFEFDKFSLYNYTYPIEIVDVWLITNHYDIYGNLEYEERTPYISHASKIKVSSSAIPFLLIANKRLHKNITLDIGMGCVFGWSEADKDDSVDIGLNGSGLAFCIGPVFSFGKVLELKWKFYRMNFKGDAIDRIGLYGGLNF